MTTPLNVNKTSSICLLSSSAHSWRSHWLMTDLKISLFRMFRDYNIVFNTYILHFTHLKSSVSNIYLLISTAIKNIKEVQFQGFGVFMALGFLCCHSKFLFCRFQSAMQCNAMLNPVSESGNFTIVPEEKTSWQTSKALLFIFLLLSCHVSLTK